MGLGRENWSFEDDRKLMCLVDEHGNRWTTISNEFPGRSVASIRNRVLRKQKAVQNGGGQIACTTCGVLKRGGHLCSASADDGSKRPAADGEDPDKENAGQPQPKVQKGPDNKRQLEAFEREAHSLVDVFDARARGEAEGNVPKHWAQLDGSARIVYAKVAIRTRGKSVEEAVDMMQRSLSLYGNAYSGLR